MRNDCWMRCWMPGSARLLLLFIIMADELLANEITIFKDRVRIDVQLSTPGIRFEDVWQRRVTMDYHGQSFYVVTREDLTASKRAAGRQVDLEDVRLLELDDDETNI